MVITLHPLLALLKYPTKFNGVNYSKQSYMLGLINNFNDNFQAILTYFRKMR